MIATGYIAQSQLEVGMRKIEYHRTRKYHDCHRSSIPYPDRMEWMEDWTGVHP